MEKFGGFLSFTMGRKISFSWEKTLPNMTSRRTSFENLSKSGWTLILETLSSPNMTFVVVVLIWYNSLVRIANRPFLFFNKHWAEAGVQIIKDLVNDDF